MIQASSVKKNSEQPEVAGPNLVARSMALLALMSLLIMGAWQLKNYLMTSSILPIEEIRLVGEFKYLDTGVLKKTIIQHIDGNFFAVNVEAIHQVIQQLAWVAVVRVDRLWPNALQVYVVEQIPVAMWRDKALVNQRGEVFLVESHQAVMGLPMLNGPPGTSHLLVEQYLDFSEILLSAGLLINRLQIDARQAWSMTLDNGIDVILGRDNVLQRLSRFLRVYEYEPAMRSQLIERVDLRYTNGFALRWENTVSQYQPLNTVLSEASNASVHCVATRYKPCAFSFEKSPSAEITNIAMV